MSDTVTLSREVLKRWLDDVGSIHGHRAFDEKELHMLENKIAAALAALQPEPQPVKQADHSELIIRLRKTHWSQTTAVNLMRDAADALEGAKP